jgi:hypothetical protein
VETPAGGEAVKLFDYVLLKEGVVMEKGDETLSGTIWGSNTRSVTRTPTSIPGTLTGSMDGSVSVSPGQEPTPDPVGKAAEKSSGFGRNHDPSPLPFPFAHRLFPGLGQSLSLNSGGINQETTCQHSKRN